MLPDRSILVRQKLVESAKIEKFEGDILGDFQIMCIDTGGAQIFMIFLDPYTKEEAIQFHKICILRCWQWHKLPFPQKTFENERGKAQPPIANVKAPKMP